MNSNLQAIQDRLDETTAELNKLIRQYGDEKSMAYFSDRFGLDDPMSADAERGVRLQGRLRRMDISIQGFAAEFFEAFPT